MRRPDVFPPRTDIQQIDVVPIHDCIEHTDGMDCICSPVHDGENQWRLMKGIDNKMVIVHRRILDERQ